MEGSILSFQVIKRIQYEYDIILMEEMIDLEQQRLAIKIPVCVSVMCIYTAIFINLQFST